MTIIHQLKLDMVHFFLIKNNIKLLKLIFLLYSNFLYIVLIGIFGLIGFHEILMLYFIIPMRPLAAVFSFIRLFS